MTDAEPAPPRTAREALAAAVAPLLAGRPRREPPTFDRASGRDVEPLAVFALAAALASFLGSLGYAVHHETERRLIARVRASEGVAEHMPRERFADVVSAELLRLPDVPATASTSARRAVADTRLLVERGSSSAYVRRLVDAITDRLPDLDPRMTFLRAGTVPDASREQRLAYMREHNRAARAAERESRRPDMELAARWCAKWRDWVSPGAHPAPEVWAAYVAAAEAAGKTPVGRTQFYRLADEVLGPRRRRATGPVYVVPAAR